jgi:thioredoxin-related protein
MHYRRSLTTALLALLLLVATTTAAWSAPAPGRLTGGSRYVIPDWFKESFLELADDAAEAAEADRHVMLFMHLDGCPYCDAVLSESIVESDYSPWLRERFDAIAINIRGAREVVFNEELTVTERELARVLKVFQTPAVIFLNGENKVVMRIDGYRTAQEFKRVLDYVDSKSYLKEDLASFVARTAARQHYAFRDHPSLRSIADLSAVQGPLLVLFEDAWCDGCDLLHDTLMKDPEVNELLDRFTVVRLDAASEAPLVDPFGKQTTPRAWTRELGLHARPAFLLFGGGEQRVRIDGVLRHFHFTSALRYVGEGRFDEFASLREFSRARTAALLEAGVTIDLGRQ